MIREIRIRNFALIEELSLEFDTGFTIFTGETGAGKSILIGAIGLLLGERASAESIRSKTDEAEVSGVFDIRESRLALQPVLDDLAIETPDDTLIIRRKISRNSSGKILVNQTPVPLAALKKLGDALVDLHGQHEHQSLLNDETHGSVIDNLPDVRPLKAAYVQAYAAFAEKKSALDAFETRASALAERREILEFQLKELSDLDLQPDDEEKLQSSLNLLASSTERAAAASEILSLIGSSQESIEKRIAAVRRNLEKLAKHDQSVTPWIGDVGNALSVITELETFCGSYLSRIGHADPAKLEQLNSRLAKIQRLKKKFSCSFTGLIEKRDSVKHDLEAIVNVDADRAEIAKAMTAALAACRKSGETLSAVRIKLSRAFDKKVTDLMETLGFTGGSWQTGFSSHDVPQPGGLESIRFMVKTNPGEPFLALAKTASGGEISRLMLAIKTVMSDQDRIPILIFDEIDTGIGGMLAGNVADALLRLASSHQVLCISHLHQIASVADHHFHVFKEAAGDRTVTRVEKLTEAKRVDEIARMLGGDSAVARQHAKELLGKTDR
ncbi:MAG: DNA repair protein RecN [Chitinispirillaceae bacterium]|jgi:DNA repair protein RecN (Recombination protein N)|nr:DNA repair protein RecN [Chitinispirillaceae bacterium]